MSFMSSSGLFGNLSTIQSERRQKVNNGRLTGVDLLVFLGAAIATLMYISAATVPLFWVAAALVMVMEEGRDSDWLVFPVWFTLAGLTAWAVYRLARKVLYRWARRLQDWSREIEREAEDLKPRQYPR